MNDYLDKLTALTDDVDGVITVKITDDERCRNCKYAELYLPFWTYPYNTPKCSLHHKTINPDDCCDDFQPIVNNEFPCSKCYHQTRCGNDDDTVISDCSEFISKDLGEIREDK